MGYNQDKRIVLDDSETIGRRYICLLHCVGQFSWLTLCGFRNELRHLYFSCGLKRGDLNSAETIVNCINELDRQRNDFLKRLNAFSNMRKAEKREGKRTPSKKEIEHLFDKRKILMEKAIKT
jgi:hypothetical protein